MTRITATLPEDLYSARQVRALDEVAIHAHDIPGMELMERAGAAAFALMQLEWPGIRSIVVVCGSGNNGGDGYVLARLAHTAGYQVSVLALSPFTGLKGDAATAAQRLIEAGLTPEPYTVKNLHKAELIVDAILGTGLDRPVTSKLQTVIEDINSSNRQVLALDIPSGLHADTGQIMGVAAHATATITFIALKQGLFTGSGPAMIGSLYFHNLNMPESVYREFIPVARRADLYSLRALLPPRPRDTHKGHCGHVLVIGGDYGYAGAVRMAAEAAGRSGAGLVSVATRREHAIPISMVCPEIMAHAVEYPEQLQPLLMKANVIAIGPGLGMSMWAQDLLARVLEIKTPLVLDADALNLLAQEPVRNDYWILTPHPGEAARLLNCAIQEVQMDRFAATRELQKKYGGVIVLKGSGTLIMDKEHCPAICSAGNPGMASGGMGDVLTGVIAGLLAQGLGLNDAARLGVCLHAAAADQVATIEGERGMLATDLLPWIHKLANPAAL